MLQFMQFNFTKHWPKKVWSGTCLSLCPAGCRGSPASLQPESPECLPAQCHHIVSLDEEGNLTTLPPRRWHGGEHIPAASQVSGTSWKHHTSNRYKCPPGFTPSFCPAPDTALACSTFLQPYSPFRTIPGASWGWFSVHQPPQNSICPARAEASAQWCSTYKADVLHQTIWYYSGV